MNIDAIARGLWDSGLIMALSLVLNFALLVGIFSTLGKRLGALLKKVVFKSIDAYIKDPEIRAAVLAEMVKVEKELGSEEGKAKMERVVLLAGRFIPGDLDDKAIRQIVNGIYAGWVSVK